MGEKLTPREHISSAARMLPGRRIARDFGLRASEMSTRLRGRAREAAPTVQSSVYNAYRDFLIFSRVTYPCRLHGASGCGSGNNHPNNILHAPSTLPQPSDQLRAVLAQRRLTAAKDP